MIIQQPTVYSSEQTDLLTNIDLNIDRVVAGPNTYPVFVTGSSTVYTTGTVTLFTTAVPTGKAWQKCSLAVAVGYEGNGSSRQMRIEIDIDNGAGTVVTIPLFYGETPGGSSGVGFGFSVPIPDLHAGCDIVARRVIAGADLVGAKCSVTLMADQISNV